MYFYRNDVGCSRLDLHASFDRLAAEGTDRDQVGAAHTQRLMPARHKRGLDGAVEADLADLQLVRGLKKHRERFSDQDIMN